MSKEINNAKLHLGYYLIWKLVQQLIGYAELILGWNTTEMQTFPMVES